MARCRTVAAAFLVAALVAMASQRFRGGGFSATSLGIPMLTIAHLSVHQAVLGALSSPNNAHAVDSAMRDAMMSVLRSHDRPGAATASHRSVRNRSLSPPPAFQFLLHGGTLEAGSPPSVYSNASIRALPGTRRALSDGRPLRRASTVEQQGGHSTSATALSRIMAHSPRLAGLHERARRLKFYIYEPPKSSGWGADNLVSRFPRCRTFQWSGDWELIQRLRNGGQLAHDGGSADFYVVPFLSKCYFNYPAAYKLAEMDAALSQVLAFLHRTPWWARAPERHLFFFMSGVGAGIVPSWRSFLSRSIFIVAEGDRQADYFRYGHDIVVPGKISTRHREDQTAFADRHLVGVFRGSLDASLRDANGGKVRKKNRLRQLLAKTLKKEGNKFVFSGHKSKSYVDEMDHSRYCIIPRGNTPWTRRFFDAVVRGCIPAVISDPVAFPFEHLLDFRKMTVKLPEQWALRLASELHAINSSAAARLQQALQLYWPAFSYAADGCAYDMLMLELAARKHNISSSWAPATINTEHDFWSPHRGHFHLADSKKVGPSWGAGAIPH